MLDVPRALPMLQYRHRRHRVCPTPPQLRVYHSSALHGTSQSSAHHLMAALLQVYHSYQSASHLLPCATQPCLAPSALISLIIFQGWAGPLAASVAGSQSHDTGVLDRPFFYLFMPPPPLPYPVHPAPRPPALLRVYRSYQSVKLASALRDTDLFMISSLSYIQYLFQRFQFFTMYGMYVCTIGVLRQEGGVSARVSAVFVSLAEKPVVSR